MADTGGGGKTDPLADQEPIGGEWRDGEIRANCGLHSAPTQFLLEFFIIAFDDQRCLASLTRPFDQKPFLGTRLGSFFIARWAGRTRTAANRERSVPWMPGRQPMSFQAEEGRASANCFTETG